MKCWSLALLLLVGCSSEPPSAPVSAGPPGTVRFASYNIEWFSEEANPQRIVHLKSVLSAIRPNVLALQEIQSRAALNQILDATWDVAMLDSDREDQELALAVKAPLKIDEPHMLFPYAGDDHAFPGLRDVLRAVVVDPGGIRFSVYVVHSKSRAGGRLKTDEQRVQAMTMLANYLQDHRKENTVVMGDFNDTPGDRSVNILKAGGRNASGFPVTGPPLLVDLYDTLYQLNGVTQGLPEGAKKPFVSGAQADNELLRGREYDFDRDAHVKQSLFDQILVSPNLSPRAGKPGIYSGRDALEGTAGQTERLRDGRTVYREKGSRASDHLPVYVDFKVGDSSK